MPNPIIDKQPGFTWQNWHSTRGVGGPVACFFTPRNAWDDGSTTPGQDFAPGLAALSAIVQQAQQDRKRVRAIGSSWSISPAAFVDDYLVNTARLSSWFLGFQNPTAYVEPPLRATADRLVFAQCGTQITTLNAFLEGQRLALPTSGASNGQTIVGAMSTGTHGSAREVGSIQDYILGLHIVAEDGKHYWVERPSRPAATPQFAQWLGATHVRDEELFLSAVVGFGSFGLIHAVMFQAVPLYLLELFIKQYDCDDVLSAATTCNVTGLGLLDGDAMPFHFEVVFNPYRRNKGDQGAFVRAIYKREFTGVLPAPPIVDSQQIWSKDMVSIAGHFSDGAPIAVPGLLQWQLSQALPPTAPGSILSTPGILFGDSQPTNGGTSIELGIPLGRTADALAAIFSVTDKHTFGAPVALRYVCASEAVLAFTCHAPITTTIEMPGIDSDSARLAHQLIFQELAARGIPFTFHWGQAGPFDNASLTASYGADRIKRWITARQAFLSPAARRTFSSAWLDGCGLSA